MNRQSQSQAAQEFSPKRCAWQIPASTKAYTKKDYAYLSSFSRVAGSVSFALHEDLEHDTSFTEFESKRQSNSLLNPGQPHLHQLHHHKQDHNKCCDYDDRQAFSESSTSTSPLKFMVNADMQKSIEENPGSSSKSELKATKFDLPSTTENCSLPPKEGPVRLKTKVKSGYVPAVLPKFGSWDRKNPPFEDAYTLIFKRLRDEKKARAIPLCELPSNSKAQEAEVFVGLKFEAKEPCFPNPRPKGNPFGSTTNIKVAQWQMKWISCFKASVLDE